MPSSIGVGQRTVVLRRAARIAPKMKAVPAKLMAI
jgi:hypothetical protein